MNKEIGMILPKKRVNTSGVGESNNYYEDIYNNYIYSFTTTLTNHTHRFHPLVTPIDSTRSPKLSKYGWQFGRAGGIYGCD